MTDEVYEPSVEKLPAKVDNTLDHLVEIALQNNAAIDVIERMFALRTQEQANVAKAEYNAAMAKFQHECPIIKRTTQGAVTKAGERAYRYATSDAIVEEIREPLYNAGFSYTFNVEMVGSLELNNVILFVTCEITHISGHSTASTFPVPLGQRTGVMSAPQQFAAAVTYGKRYAFCNALGIMTADEDTDARRVKHYITTEQLSELEALLKQANQPVDKIISLCKVNTISEITTGQATHFIRQLKRMLNVEPIEGEVVNE